MAGITVRHVALANDIFSYEKATLIHGSPVNLIHVLRAGGTRDITSAAIEAIEIVNHYVERFCQLETQLTADPGLTEADLSHYVYGMETWMRGNVEFSVRNKRFRSATSPFTELSHCVPDIGDRPDPQ